MTQPAGKDLQSSRPERGSRLLADLLGSLSSPPGPAGPGPEVRGVTANSREVTDGSIFVAVRGERSDGHDFVPDAARSGAVAAVVEREIGEDVGIPLIRVANSRRALAELAAAWHGRPAERLSLTGITGTMGKTSTLAMLESILVAEGLPVGTIGSLGVRIAGKAGDETGYTSPDALVLHRALGSIVEGGCSLAAMEVTSHALAQERVHGLRFDLGIFTNLVPLEHLDYHGSFRNYVEAKRRFLDHLHEDAPVVYNIDDPGACRVVRGSCARPIGCGTARDAAVRVEPEETRAEGTKLSLDIRSPLPHPGGGEVAPLRLPLELQLLGPSNVGNATLAATAALCLGARPETVQEVLGRFPPPRRRLEVVHRGRFIVLDDTLGHPDSISALFQLIEKLSPNRIHAAYAVRGQRGAQINDRNAEALAVWAERTPVETLIVTRSSEAADERNRVEEEECTAFRAPLREHGISFRETERLDDAVREVLERAGAGDIVLLLGAQGMDAGRQIARAWLEEHGEE